MSRRGRIAWIGALGLVALALCATPASAIDFGKTADQIKRAFGSKPPDPPPRVGKSERQRARKPGAAGATNPAGAPDGATSSVDTLLARPEILDEILLTPEPYAYRGYGRRDPFVSLVSEEWLETHEEEALELVEFRVVGILWGERERSALVEGIRGTSFILHEGDRLGRYTVSRIEPDGILVYTPEYGVGRTERLALTEWRGRKNVRNDR